MSSSEEPRRSGRATKGQHKNASSSPAPQPKPSKTVRKKSEKTSQEPEDEGDDDDEEKIRCICGNDNAKDKRAFIGCDACTVWQHNVCMGVPEEEDDVPDHYFCEECRPQEHQETLQALAKGEKIWEVRNRIWNNEKKSKNRKGKGKGDGTKPGWLKKDEPSATADGDGYDDDAEVGSKRKREEIKGEAGDAEDEQNPLRSMARQDKRRKSSQVDSKADLDTETALVAIDQLPVDRRRIAQALCGIIAEDVQARAKAGHYRVPDGETPKSLAEHYAVRIEYALSMNHGGVQQEKYKAQFRALHANLKQNKVLIEQLLKGKLTPDELSVMESKDLASAELQQERAAMKEELDRQVVAIQEEGPRTVKTHKGDEVITSDDYVSSEHRGNMQPVRERSSVSEREVTGMRPPSSDGKAQSPLAVDTSKRPSDARRQSSQQFDMTSIWAKTAQSPTSSTGNPLRPMQQKPRRKSSVPVKPLQESPSEGAKVDPDVDRLLEPQDDDYSPVDSDAVVWQGRLVQSSGEGDPTVNARFVAGRDIRSTVKWKDLLPAKLRIDGRLQVDKAEEYLCGLQWSSSSDVAVLSLTPFDDADAFNSVFDYFKARERYAVVKDDRPPMVKDLYIIPVDTGTQLPEHIEKLEHCTLKLPIEQRLLLATFVINRNPGTPQIPDTTPREPQQGITNGGQQHLPQHLRAGASGPSGSPLNSSAPTFSPGHSATPQAGYGAPPFPPNPYGSHQADAFHPSPQQFQPSANPLVAEVLGEFQYAPTAQQILTAEPGIDRAKLENLRKIMEAVPEARTNLEALATRLFSQ